MVMPLVPSGTLDESGTHKDAEPEAIAPSLPDMLLLFQSIRSERVYVGIHWSFNYGS